MDLRSTRVVWGTIAFLGLSACGWGSGGGGGGDGGATPPSSDATLADLSASAGPLDPAFAPSTTAYTVGPVAATSTTVTATTAHASATLTIAGDPATSGVPSASIALAIGPNPVTVTVTAEDGVTQISYVLVVTRVAPALAGLEAYVKASNTEAGDSFGNALAISGETLVVGTIYENSSATGVNGVQTDASAPLAGAVYVFVRNGTTWSQEAYLKASNTATGDQFGASVAISGDTIVVGAPTEDGGSTGTSGNDLDNSASNAGAAYVFVRSGTTWSQQAYLKASNTDAQDRFGGSVAIDGDTIVVCARNEQSAATGVGGDQADDSLSNAGAAYVFVRSGTTWSQQAYVKPSNTDADDLFGRSVAIDGGTVVIGTDYEDGSVGGVDGADDDAASDAGAAYVFVRNGTTWSQQAYLKGSNPNVGDYFGFSVSISGDTIVAGTQGEDSSATGVDGAATDNGATDSGAAFVFHRVGSTWTQQAYLKASNTGPNDSFGAAVGVFGDRIVVGAFGERSSATGLGGLESDDSFGGAGAAYVFQRTGSTWSQETYVKATNTAAADFFGTTVAIGTDTVAVGAIAEDSSAVGVGGDQLDEDASGAGAVYVYR